MAIHGRMSLAFRARMTASMSLGRWSVDPDYTGLSWDIQIVHGHCIPHGNCHELTCSLRHYSLQKWVLASALGVDRHGLFPVDQVPTLADLWETEVDGGNQTDQSPVYGVP